MSLHYFLSCAAVLYAPYYLVYKYSGLSEYGAFWKCVHAGVVYVFTQLFKMLLLATFFYTETTATGGEFNFITELLRSTIDIVDVLGLAFILSRIPGKGHCKLLTAGVGWAAAEAVLSRSLLLWFGARGADFSWDYIQKCIESNILLLQHITTATLVWLYTRHDLERLLQYTVRLLLVFTIYKGVWLEGFCLLCGLNVWSSLAVKALAALSISLVSLYTYTGLAKKIGI